MKIINLKKNLYLLKCNVCNSEEKVYKYSKTLIHCSGCTTLLATPRANKCKLIQKNL